MTKRFITLAATVSAVALHAQAWGQTDWRANRDVVKTQGTPFHRDSEHFPGPS